MSVNKYRIYCNTESAWTEGYGISAPTKCYTDTSHIVNANSVQVLEEISNSVVVVKEETTPTGQHFASKIITIDALGPTGTVTVVDHSFPIPINMLNIFYTTCPDHDGDLLSAEVAPDTIIGILSAGVTSGIQTGITVSQTVIDNIALGYHIGLNTGVTSQNLGQCTGIDTNNLMINTEFPTTISYDEGTYVQMSIKMMHDYELTGNERRELGAYKIGSSYVPANTIGRLSYTNNNGLPKKFRFGIEYLY